MMITALGLTVSVPDASVAQDDRVSYRCVVSPNAGRNKKKTPAWINLEVDFYSGRAVATMPDIKGTGEFVEEARVRRDTSKLFSVSWRALAALGIYTPVTNVEHRVTIFKASNTGRYRTETVRERGSLGGKLKCQRQ